MQKNFHVRKWMEQELHSVESDIPDDKVLSELNDLLVIIHDLVSNITVMNDAI